MCLSLNTIFCLFRSLHYMPFRRFSTHNCNFSSFTHQNVLISNQSVRPFPPFRSATDCSNILSQAMDVSLLFSIFHTHAYQIVEISANSYATPNTCLGSYMCPHTQTQKTKITVFSPFTAVATTNLFGGNSFALYTQLSGENWTEARDFKQCQ